MLYVRSDDLWLSLTGCPYYVRLNARRSLFLCCATVLLVPVYLRRSINQAVAVAVFGCSGATHAVGCCVCVAVSEVSLTLCVCVTSHCRYMSASLTLCVWGHLHCRCMPASLTLCVWGHLHCTAGVTQAMWEAGIWVGSVESVLSAMRLRPTKEVKTPHTSHKKTRQRQSEGRDKQ